MQLEVIKKNGKTDLRGLKFFFQCAQDGNYKVTIGKVRDNRSNAQNNYLWGVVYPFIATGLREVGYPNITIDDAHDFCKHKFAQRNVVNHNTGEIINLPSSTAKMDVVQFSHYVDQIKAFAEEYLNIQIPQPNEND